MFGNTRTYLSARSVEEAETNMLNCCIALLNALIGTAPLQSHVLTTKKDIRL